MGRPGGPEDASQSHAERLDLKFKPFAQKVGLWFEIANTMLGNVSPRDMIRIGRYKRLLNFVIEAREAEAATPR